MAIYDLDMPKFIHKFILLMKSYIMEKKRAAP